MQTSPSRPDLPTARAALMVLLLVLVAANIIRTLVVADDWQFWFNLALGATGTGIGLAAGLRTAELGLARRSIRSGLCMGGSAALAISVPIVILGLAGALKDDRVDVSFTAMLIKVLVTIPIGTVLVEELLFRGVLDGLLRTAVKTPAKVVVAGAVAFGAWHVLPAVNGGGVDTGTGSTETVVLTFVATTAFGAFLIWLRRRSRSLVAPALAHVATNSLTFAVAWVTR